MKNTYLTSYFPLLAIILFSVSISIRVELILLDFLKNIGIYSGMLEFFSEGGIKLALLILLVAISFMVLAAFKLVADTTNGLALLFFSKDAEGESLNKIRSGSIIYFVGGAISLVSMYSFIGIGIIFTLTTVIYLIYFVYKSSGALSMWGIIGMIFFQVVVWSTLLIGLMYIAVKVYNSIMASLPV
ncbi:YufK family protein [Cytobacillus spongiae]|uniref:DUF5366 family protein n=1 Tax=Cytobacillus spongiae TaxID=2901381 RepID=UPI001F385013|nr:DUF5366 family protein [Cytobacillus spongiae]UII55367.1 YufK family protein [Cytobacillus spongiae]